MKILKYLVSYAFIALGAWLVLSGAALPGMIALAIGGSFVVLTYFTD
jgi:ABC-type protease/lipase transport system fused ATPase/permease subunit